MFHYILIINKVPHPHLHTSAQIKVMCDVMNSLVPIWCWCLNYCIVYVIAWLCLGCSVMPEEKREPGSIIGCAIENVSEDSDRSAFNYQKEAKSSEWSSLTASAYTDPATAEVNYKTPLYYLSLSLCLWLWQMWCGDLSNVCNKSTQ